jgi:hypothetical protein
MIKYSAGVECFGTLAFIGNYGLEKTGKDILYWARCFI